MPYNAGELTMNGNLDRCHILSEDLDCRSRVESQCDCLVITDQMHATRFIFKINAKEIPFQ